MKHTAKKTLAMLLCLVMVIGLLPGTAAWADEPGNGQQEEEPVLVTVVFTSNAEETAITVTADGEAVDAQEDGSYALPYGEYTYSASAEGYVSVEEPFTVSEEDGERKEIEIALELISTDEPEETNDEPEEINAKDQQTVSAAGKAMLLESGLTSNANGAGSGSRNSHTHGDITFTAWESTSSLPNEAGSYYLTGDVTLGDTWTVPSGTTNLCLNGKEVSVREAPGGAFLANYSIVNVPSGAILNLYDEAGNLGKLANAAIRREFTNKTGGGVCIAGTLNMYGGKICDNDMIYSNYGAGVYVSGTGTFNMYGGEISNNSAGDSADDYCYGGGVYVAANGTFTMSGGLICDNLTGNAGGGVYVAENGTFTMSGGTIRDNTAIGDGGGVDNCGGRFAMSGGTITGNTVTSGNGGGIIVEGSGVTCSLSGSADISGNHKGSDDNNIYLQSGKHIKVAGPLTNTNPIGVTMQAPGVFTTGSTDTLKASDYLDKFVSDDSACAVQPSGNELTLKRDGDRTEVSYLYYENDAAAIAQTPTTGTQACMKVESSNSEVTWSDDWYVVSEDAVIDVASTRIQVNGVVNLILMDGKKLTANQGIHVGPDATLNIYAQSTGDEAGTLIANGFSAGAGIGGASNEAGGTITIHGGTVRATGGEDYGGAGIGGGMGGAGGTITIHGGAVTGTGKRDGAGIGGGPSGAGGTITINGGTVTATSIKARYSSCGAGIGSGFRGAGGTITINGGTVNATGGEEGGAGIGSGYRGAGGNVTINDGEVTATGGKKGGAGIGGGNTSAGGTITIHGGTVNATGGQLGGAGIGGGGNRGAGGNVTITGGTVNATGGDKGAGIGGGGLLSAGGTVTINGGEVTATGGNQGAGIGGGNNGVGGTVSISGGTVTANGAAYAAGIGGGAGGAGGTVTISGGEVTAAGGNNGGAGIGGGCDGAGSEVAITGGTVKAYSDNDSTPGIGAGLNSANQGTVALGAGAVVKAENVALADKDWEDLSAVSCEAYMNDHSYRRVYIISSIAVTGVTLQQGESDVTALTLDKGESVTLTAVVAPENASDKSVTWASDNTAVATVVDGVVTAVAAGSATITATATNGTETTDDDFSASCDVNVSDPAPSASIDFKGGSLRRRVYRGTTDVVDFETDIRFGFEFTLPEGATINMSDSYFCWKNNSVATAEDGNKVTIRSVDTSGEKPVANLILTGVPKAYYTTNIFCFVHVEYTLNEQVYTIETVEPYSRSVKQVCDSLVEDTTAPELWRNYAKSLLDAIG